jgi:Baseplate J-like protein
MADAPVLSHLVYLDSDDEITSAAARIRTTEAPQITLVLPYGSRLATSRINFRLLAREATERGKRLDIVCGDASARALAAAAGLPVHASVAAYEGSRDAPAGEGEAAQAPRSQGIVAAPGAAAPTTQPQLPELADTDDDTAAFSTPRQRAPRVPIVGPARPPVPPRVALGVGIGVIAAVVILGLLALQLLPAATIVLHPRSEPVGPLLLTVQARTDITAPDPERLVIPAQRFTFPLEATETVTATGTRIENVKATGEVVFSNFDTGSGVFIPKGTLVRTRGQDKVEFVTREDLTLPRAQIDFFPPFSTHPSTGTAGIEAVVAGVDGNVGNNTITDIPEAGKLLKANNPDPTTGGAHTESPEISQEDVDVALAAIDAALAAGLDEQLSSGTDVPSGITLLIETKAVGDPVFDSDPQTLVGGTESEVDISATADGSVLGVDQGPIEGMAESRLAEAVDAGWTLADRSTTFDLGDPSVFGDVISFSISVGATQVRDVDRDALLAQIRGLGAAQARGRLEPYGDVDLSLWPDWVTAVPSNDDRIDFTIGEPQPAPSAAP